MADNVGFLSPLNNILPWMNIGGNLGSHAAITVSGAVLGMMLKKNNSEKLHKMRINGALLYGLALALGGILLHSLHDLHRIFIINKIFATPPWCLLCSAITIGVWVIIYWLMDVRGWKRWTFIVAPAGQNALFSYILAPIFYSLFPLIAIIFGGFNFYIELGSSFAMGFWRSLIMAFGLTWLAGRLRSVGIWLKL